MSHASVLASQSFDARVNALSLSPDNCMFAAGGRAVLQVSKINYDLIEENIASVIDRVEDSSILVGDISRNSIDGRSLSPKKTTKLTSKQAMESIRDFRTGRLKKNLSLSSNDVKWNPHPGSSEILATAATNGAVIVWNISRPGKSAKMLEVRHSRTVNRLCWNPRNSSELLSASLQEVVKLWDTRSGSSTNFRCKSECRDVAFDPFSYSFAAALENGVTQVWDVRQPMRPLKRIPSHDLVLTLAWHPTIRGRIATGGRDRVIHIWNTTRSSDGVVHQSGAKISNTIQTISTVSRVRWRTGRDNELISSAGVLDSNASLWDLNRPNFPTSLFYGHKNTVTDMHWLSIDLKSVKSYENSHISNTNTSTNTNIGNLSEVGQHSITSIGEYVIDDGINYDINNLSTESCIKPANFLLTSSKDGTVKLHSVEHSHRPLAHMCTTAVSFSPLGEIVCVSDYKNENSTTKKSQKSQNEMRNVEFLRSNPKAILNVVSEYDNDTSEYDNDTGNIDKKNSFQTFHKSSHKSSHNEKCKRQFHSSNFGFDFNRVLYCAQNYKLTMRRDIHCDLNNLLNNEKNNERFGCEESGNVSCEKILKNEKCTKNDLLTILECNANVAANAGDDDLCSMWNFVRDLFRCEILSDVDVSSENISNQTVETNDDSRVKIRKVRKKTKVSMYSAAEYFDLSDSDCNIEISTPVNKCVNRVIRSNRQMLPSTFGLIPRHDTNVNTGTENSTRNSTNSTLDNNTNNRKNNNIKSNDRASKAYQTYIETADEMSFDSIANTNTTKTSSSSPSNKKIFRTQNIFNSNNRKLPKGIMWVLDDAIESIINWYSEKGDVQTVVVLLIILLEHSQSFIFKSKNASNLRNKTQIQNIKNIEGIDLSSEENLATSNPKLMNVDSNSGKAASVLPWSKPKLQEWAMCYLDLLYQLQEWTHATEVALLCGHKAIATMNTNQTSIASVCGQPDCNAILDDGESINGRCTKCTKLISVCAICQLPTKGVFVWCQGCGHGGHLEHIAEWFLNVNDKQGDSSSILNLCDLCDNNRNELSSKNETHQNVMRMPCPSGCGHICCFNF